jgi:hypothetical protein
VPPTGFMLGHSPCPLRDTPSRGPRLRTSETRHSVASHGEAKADVFCEYSSHNKHFERGRRSLEGSPRADSSQAFASLPKTSNIFASTSRIHEFRGL